MSVDVVLGKLAAGMTTEAVAEEYSLTRDDVPAALAYAAHTLAVEEVRAAISPSGTSCASPSAHIAALLLPASRTTGPRPIAAVLLGLTLALIAAPALSPLRRVLRTVGVEGSG